MKADGLGDGYYVAYQSAAAIHPERIASPSSQVELSWQVRPGVDAKPFVWYVLVEPPLC
jgi:hypothetical protein